MGIKRVAKQIARGTTTLPHVGNHPGTVMLLMFYALGFAAGRWFGLAVFVVFYTPIYLYGSYDRAELSDRLVREENED